jgi:hypothetical protein
VFANARRERGFGLKGQNRAVVARFRVHRVKQQRGMVRRGGVVVRIRWWWWWGCALTKREAGRGFGLKSETKLLLARFRACHVKQRWGMVHRGGVVVSTRWWGCALAKQEAERGFRPKPETELLWLNLGCAM